jgi:hypothetical protein
MGGKECPTGVLHRQKPAVRETPDFEGLFRYWKTVAVCAVICEPVSLLFSQYQGDLRKKQRPAGLKFKKPLQHSGFRAFSESR